LKNGSPESAEEAFKCLAEAFDLFKIFQHFMPKEYKIWKDGKEEIDGKNNSQKKEDKSDPKTKPKIFDKEEDLTESQKKDIRETFELFDKKKSGFVSPQELDGMFRAMGFVPTPLEIEQAKRGLEREGKKTVDLERFIQIIKPRVVDKETEKDLEKAFKYLDFN